MTTGRTRAAVWFFALGAVGVAYRLIYVFDLVGRLDGDNAVVALMARHILDGRHYVFFWGQSYMGSLEAYSVAAVAAVFGLNDVVLRAVPLVYAALYMASFRWLGEMLYDRATGRAALALAALSPPLLAVWSSAPRGGYSEALLLGQLALLLGLDLARRRPTAWGAPAAIALGLVAGLALWTHLLTIVFLSTAVAVLAFRDPRLPLRPHAWLALGAFTLGSLPLWLHDLTHGFDTFALVSSARESASLGHSIRALVLAHGPKLLGVRDLVGAQAILLPPLGHLAALVVVAGVTWAALRATRDAMTRPRGSGPGGEVFVLLLAVLAAVYLPSRFATWNTQRYLLPAYSAILPLAAAAWVALARRSRAAAVIAAVIVLVVFARGAWTLHLEFARPPRHDPYLPEVVDFLVARGIAHGYAESHDEALVNTYRSGERVILVDRGIGRYPLGEVSDWRPRAILVHGDGGSLAATLEALRCRFTVRRFGSHTLFHDLEADAAVGRALPRDRWRVGASVFPGEASLAIDGDLATRWASHSAQRPGTSFEIDLGATEAVTGVRLHSGSFAQDVPRGLRVEGETGEGEWRELGTLARPYPGVRVEDGRIRFRAEAVVEVRFAPLEVRRLRVVQTGSDPRFDWSIAETEVIGAR